MNDEVPMVYMARRVGRIALNELVPVTLIDDYIERGFVVVDEPIEDLAEIDEPEVDDNEDTDANGSTEDAEKEALVARAVDLGIGAPSTLRRWGVDRLEKEIAEKEAGA